MTPATIGPLPDPWHHRGMAAAPAATADPIERWSSTVVLADGETGYVRPIRSMMPRRSLAFHDRQPRENLYRRFFSPKPT